MKLKRREFLFLTGLSAIATACTAKSSSSQAIQAISTASAKISIPAKKGMLLRFVSVADTGTGAKGQYNVAKAMTNYHSKNTYDLVVLAGDNIYNNGEIEKINAVFERPYADLLKAGVKFQACLGNHDIRTANGENQVKYAGFNMKGRYYTFSRGEVQFFALDTNDIAGNKQQIAWLEKELSSSKAPWKIVFGHHPIYSSGYYASNPTFVQLLTPLFQKYGVQVYINGHDHNYERTQSINGTTYVICGAGAGNRPVGKSQWTEYSTSDLSFAAYQVYPDRIEISGIGIDNRVFDKGVIKLKST
ncbi:MAG: metallophosphoesterase [Cyanomargarita calcarea GSE-NOS-MK-12-04C]|jgi:3',5'-cyclic AMP phosphodiesterase CpdA|uniref:Metallophosphoesterase n=1 Tax=Cyanomargarita calcarea GSE-NOS-MK-12-04C TaxID=2839659 RepID=A0A951QMD5_9CYAN|nr:metallophosphoesterase [Cyanomargarita calcarea GSE-NOS-MK-12-04C]